MLKIIICEDHQACLEKAISATHKALGNYDIDYKMHYLNDKEFNPQPFYKWGGFKVVEKDK